MVRFNPGLEAGFAEESVAVDENGVRHRVVNWVLSPAEYEQVRQGYRCLHCMEPFTAAFPERCGLCGFRVRAEQVARLENDFLGTHMYGAVDDDRGMDERERREWVPRSGIWVPGRD
jgi:hypothetical protein